MGIRWGTADLTDEQVLQGLDAECSTGIDPGAFRRQLMFKAVKRILELLLEIRRGLPVAMLLILLGGCATEQAAEKRPFFYYHSTYPEQFDNDASCHGCDGRYAERHGFSERERNRRLQNLYGKMRR